MTTGLLLPLLGILVALLALLLPATFWLGWRLATATDLGRSAHHRIDGVEAELLRQIGLMREDLRDAFLKCPMYGKEHP